MDAKYLAAAALGAATALVSNRLIVKIASKESNKQNDDTDASASSIRRPNPHQKWQAPDPLPPPFDPNDRITLDPATTPSDKMYTFMITAIVPRPIAFVSTVSTTGEGNLAPYSYFSMVSHYPPYVVIGCAASRLRQHGKKDTLVNILETKEFVINIISEWFIEAANHTCGNFDYGVNELHLSGLTPQPSTKIKPPRIAESAIQFECQLRHTYDIKDASGKVCSTLVVGEVVVAHVASAVTGTSPTGKMIADVEKLKPISRLGGNTYGRSEGLFDLPRPDHEVLGGGGGKKPLVYTINPQ